MPAHHANKKPVLAKTKKQVLTCGPARNASSKAIQRVLFSTFILAMVSLTFLNIYEFISRPPKIIVIQTSKDDEAFWENIQKEYPTYKDAYLVLSNIKKQEGDVLSAEDFKKEAFKIDPYLDKNL